MKCDCRISMRAPKAEIVYCPLHEAAGDMREALREAQSYIARNEMYQGRQDRTQLEEKMITALAKAEGNNG